MYIKASELEGAALDYAVAAAIEIYVFTDAGGVLRQGGLAKPWNPSTSWSQGGPLIERYIGATQYEGDRGPEEPFYAETRCENMEAYANGTTLLIAAMRAIVASELGDEVDVPEELL